MGYCYLAGKYLIKVTTTNAWKEKPERHGKEDSAEEA